MNNQNDSKDKKIVVLVGNGLGRSFDNEGFSTESILKNLFKPQSQALSFEAVSFFSNLFHNSYPRTEDELGMLEEMSEAFNLMDSFPLRFFLCNTKEQKDSFINGTFKTDLDKYFKELKTKFLKSIQENSQRILNDRNNNGYTVFRKKFIGFVSEIRPTIATLNYDVLLYNAFFEDEEFVSDIFKQKERGYTDGFISFKNKASKKLPKFEKNFFWLTKGRMAYLHLHGAYFYTVSEDDEIEKQPRSYEPNITNDHSVILTSQKKKAQKIYSSPKDCLHIYTGHFFEELCKADHIIIFGYGGGDKYFNSILRYSVLQAAGRNETRKVTIVDRCCEEITNEELQNRWSTLLTNETYEIQTCGDNNISLSNQVYPYEIRRVSPLHQFEWNF